MGADSGCQVRELPAAIVDVERRVLPWQLHTDTWMSAVSDLRSIVVRLYACQPPLTSCELPYSRACSTSSATGALGSEGRDARGSEGTAWLQRWRSSTECGCHLKGTEKVAVAPSSPPSPTEPSLSTASASSASCCCRSVRSRIKQTEAVLRRVQRWSYKQRSRHRARSGARRTGER